MRVFSLFCLRPAECADESKQSESTDEVEKHKHANSRSQGPLGKICPKKMASLMRAVGKVPALLPIDKSSILQRRVKVVNREKEAASQRQTPVKPPEETQSCYSRAQILFLGGARKCAGCARALCRFVSPRAARTQKTIPADKRQASGAVQQDRDATIDGLNPVCQ